MREEKEIKALTPFKKAAAFFLSLVLRAISLTLRWEKRGLMIENRHWTMSSPTIMVFWHGDQLMMPWAYRSRELKNGAKELHALVSMHNDGRIAASALRHLSINTVNGSSTKGGLRSLLQLRQRLADNKHVAITPDGPKGPPKIAKMGAVMLSSTSGANMLPISIVVEKFWQLKSWDKMFIPKPFSRAIIYAGQPYTAPPNLSKADLEMESKKLGNVLDYLKFRAGRMLSSEYLKTAV